MKLSIRTKLIFLLFVLMLATIMIISGQAYKVALKDMSNNAKFSTRIYAKNISKIIEERMQTVKEKILFAVLNEEISKNGSTLIFKRSPEVLAIIEYYFPTLHSKQELQGILLNPNYKNKFNISEDEFLKLESFVDFKIALKDNEFINVAKLPKPISDVIVYTFPLKIAGSKGVRMFVAAVIPDVILTAISSGRSKYINYLIDNRGQVLAHPDTSKLNQSLTSLSIFKGFYESDMLGERTMEYIDEENNNVIGSIFRIKRSNISIVSKILQTEAYAEAEKLKIILGFTSIFVFIISLIFSLFFAKTLTDPIRKLSVITEEIAKGNFLVEVNIPSKDEIGQLADSFKQMGHELYDREEALKTAQGALVQSEKMAAFGQIGAGIAHEVKNPLTGILGHAQLAREKLLKNAPIEDIRKSLDIIEKETTRTKTIIENLMKFTRQERSEHKSEPPLKIVNEAIDLVNHQLTINGVKIIKEFSENMPNVMVNANQIEQVLMNLMLNAQHAMESSPEKSITVRLFQSIGDYVCIEIEDTGTGMSEDVKSRIFEPFFTTKPAGKGTGLGLSVSYGIIKEHKGIIEVESVEEIGTRFIIQLPRSEFSPIIDNKTYETPPKLPEISKIPTLSPIKPQGGYKGQDPVINKVFQPPKMPQIEKKTGFQIEKPQRQLTDTLDEHNKEVVITRPKKNNGG